MTGRHVEHDSMGTVEVPDGALWKAQTQRAVENFPISGNTVDLEVIRALALVKAAAARANRAFGVIGPEQEHAVIAAATAIFEGEYDDQFPVDIFQTGSGTSTNMNVNEVISSIAAERGVEVHPNDHVNASQSSNDTFPTAIRVAAAQGAVRLQASLTHLAETLRAKSEEFQHHVKAGRTHLADATPVTLGQEMAGYARIVELGVERISSVFPRLLELPLGGTAVGTGINTPSGFGAATAVHLADATGIPFTEATDHFEAQGGQDAVVELSGQLRTIAVGLTKICNDLRWMGSGPSAGLGEIRIPDLQPGSSIMPGKVNPVLPEATLMVCAQVVGNDATVALAGAAGNFELNVMLPVMAHNVVESLRLLTSSTRLLADRCIAGITSDAEHLRRLAESSAAIVTPLNRLIGYEAAAAVAKHAMGEGITIRQAVIDLGYVERGALTVEQLDEALDVDAMTRPS